MDGQKVVKVFCHEDESIERFDQLNNDLYASAYNANRYANILGPINVQLGNLSYVVVAIVGGLVAINGIGGFTLGSLASFLTLNKSFQQPINQISNQLNSIVMALAGGDRIFRLLDEKPEVDDGYVTLTDAVVNADGTITESNKRTGTWAWKHYHKAEGTTDYRQLKGDVVFEHVDFGYNDDKMVLHDVSLYAQPGQKIAFVGSTGAGKTTITNLINRFYEYSFIISIYIIKSDLNDTTSLAAFQRKCINQSLFMHNSLDFKKKRNYTILKTKENLIRRNIINYESTI